MDEASWLRSADPGPMLELVRGRASERKLRLFALACCHRIWHLREQDTCRRAVEAAERFADGVAADSEVIAALGKGRDWTLGRDLARQEARQAAERLQWETVAAVAYYRQEAEGAAHYFQRTDWYLLTAAERVAQAALARCIFGNPFRPAVADPYWLGWNGGSLLALARSIYEDRRWEDMPVLADALEEAGCGDEGMLRHCRTGEHTRGCWVVDLLLGKA